MEFIDPQAWHRARRILHDDLEAVVDWLNARSDRHRNPEAFKACIAIAEQRTSGVGIPYLKVEKYAEALQPHLDEAQRLLGLRFFPEPVKAGNPGDDPDLSLSIVRAGRKSPIDGIYLESKLAPECMLVLGLYTLIEQSDKPNINTMLRRCERDDCEKFFIDHSPSGRGKYCSSRCRGRSFRKVRA